MKSKTIYRLSVADIQQVAKEIYGRKLVTDEIERVTALIGDRISWYEVIDDAISCCFALRRIDQDKHDVSR